MITFEVQSVEKGQAAGDLRLWFIEDEELLSFPRIHFRLGQTYRIFAGRLDGHEGLFFAIGCGPSHRILDSDQPGEVHATGRCASCSASESKGMPGFVFWLLAFCVVTCKRPGRASL